MGQKIMRSPVQLLGLFRWKLANRVHSLDSISPRSSETDDNDEARMTNEGQMLGSRKSDRAFLFVIRILSFLHH